MVFPHKFWRPFLDCMPQLFFRPQNVWFPVHLKGHLIPLCNETLVVNWQNWLFTLLHQSRSVLSPNPVYPPMLCLLNWLLCQGNHQSNTIFIDRKGAHKIAFDYVRSRHQQIWAQRTSPRRNDDGIIVIVSWVGLGMRGLSHAIILFTTLEWFNLLILSFKDGWME